MARLSYGKQSSPHQPERNGVGVAGWDELRVGRMIAAGYPVILVIDAILKVHVEEFLSPYGRPFEEKNDYPFVGRRFNEPLELPAGLGYILKNMFFNRRPDDSGNGYCVLHRSALMPTLRHAPPGGLNASFTKMLGRNVVCLLDLSVTFEAPVRVFFQFHFIASSGKMHCISLVGGDYA